MLDIKNKNLYTHSYQSGLISHYQSFIIKINNKYFKYLVIYIKFNLLKKKNNVKFHLVLHAPIK